MWALAEHVARVERSEWRKLFGTEFTGLHEGKPVRFVWGERTVGHLCRGTTSEGHIHCIRMVVPAWVFEVRG